MSYLHGSTGLVWIYKSSVGLQDKRPTSRQAPEIEQSDRKKCYYKRGPRPRSMGPSQDCYFLLLCLVALFLLGSEAMLVWTARWAQELQDLPGSTNLAWVYKSSVSLQDKPWTSRRAPDIEFSDRKM